MKFKHFAAYLIVIVLVFGLTGCTTKEVSYEDDLEDEAPLRAYLLKDYDYRFFIDYYNRTKPKGNRSIEITEFDNEDPNAMYEQLLNEIAVGKGPDIIFTNEITDNYIDIQKIAKQNVLADMDILIENDGEFDFDDYNTMALDTGIINGKRVFIPISYKVDFLIGVEECFKNNGIKVPDELTLETYCDVIEEYYQTRANAPAMLGMDPVYLLSEYIKVGEPIKKDKELKRLFKILKIEDARLKQVGQLYFDDPIYRSDNWPYNGSDGHAYQSYFGFYDLFIKNNLLFKKSDIDNREEFFRLHDHYNFIRHNEAHMIIFRQPFADNRVKAYVDEALAININSKHKNEAFDFVKFMISKSVEINSMYNAYLPVNEEAMEYVIDDFFDGCSYLYFLDEKQIPTNMMEDFVGYIESAETCKYIGNFKYVYHNIINQCIEDYYDDHITFDEMIDEMNNKMAIYLSE